MSGAMRLTDEIVAAISELGGTASTPQVLALLSARQPPLPFSMASVRPTLAQMRLRRRPRIRVGQAARHDHWAWTPPVWELTDAGRASLDRMHHGAMPLWERCACALARLGGTGSTVEVRRQLQEDGGRAAGEQQAYTGLTWLMTGRKPALAEIVTRGRRHMTAEPTIWRLTAAGRAWAAARDGQDVA